MKYLLVIGAGENQVPIIRTAKSLGCYVYVVTIFGDYPGIYIADEWIERDIFDKEGIVSIFADGNKPIDGVISDQSDMAAPIVAFIAEKLNLPTWGYKNSLFFTDKDLMRELLEHIGLPVPKYKKVVSSEDAIKVASKIGYPIVIKPTNSFSSRGITKVRKEEDIANAYELAFENSRTHEVVLEKYISGKQFFSQGFVSDFKLNLFAFSDRYYYDLSDVFIPYTNAFPAIIDYNLKRRMVSDFQKIIHELKPRFGHVWAEWILDDVSGELYIVEIAIRGGGAHVTTELIPLAYGIDTQPLLVREALGENTHFYDFSRFDNKSAAFYSFLLPKGKILSVEGVDRIKSINGVVCSDIKEMKIGSYTEDIKDKRSRYGLVVVKGKDRKEIDSIWKMLKKTVNIQVETPEGIKGPIWE